MLGVVLPEAGECPRIVLFEATGRLEFLLGSCQVLVERRVVRRPGRMAERTVRHEPLDVLRCVVGHACDGRGCDRVAVQECGRTLEHRPRIGEARVAGNGLMQ